MSSSPSHVRIPLSVETSPISTSKLRNTALIFLNCVINLLSFTLFNCTNSVLNRPLKENPLYVPSLIAFHTSSFSTWNIANRLPSLTLSKPVGLIPLAVSLMKNSLRYIPSSNSNEWFKSTLFALFWRMYFSAIFSIVCRSYTM